MMTETQTNTFTTNNFTTHDRIQIIDLEATLITGNAKRQFQHDDKFEPKIILRCTTHKASQALRGTTKVSQTTKVQHIVDLKIADNPIYHTIHTKSNLGRNSNMIIHLYPNTVRCINSVLFHHLYRNQIPWNN